MKFVLSIVLILASFASAQEIQAPSFSQEVSVSVVNLYASVQDKKGRPVYGLNREDFTLYENGRRQEISHFSADTTEPLNLAILLDVSGSMKIRNKLGIAKGIIRDITTLLRKDDQVALLIFADGEVQRLIDFTTDKQLLLNRMEQLEPFGGTALRDAIAYCHRLLVNNVGKKGVLLFSDGVDNRSELTLGQATTQAAGVEVPVYTFELIRSKFVAEGKEKEVDEASLKAFADATGGLYFALQDATQEQVSKASTKIFQDLKYQYYIGYVPRHSDSTYGRIELKTKNDNHRVRVRYSVIHGG